MSVRANPKASTIHSLVNTNKAQFISLNTRLQHNTSHLPLTQRKPKHEIQSLDIKSHVWHSAREHYIIQQAPSLVYYCLRD